MRWIALVVVGVCACGSKAAPVSATSNSRPAERVPDAPTSPYDYRTWTAKLGDPKESERAITELEQLGNPAAIPALGDAWREQGRPVRIVQVIIGLARPLTADEAKAQFVTEYETTGRPASWNVAMPLLVEAIDKVDVGNAGSIDSAIKAADAIGEAKDPAGVDVLAKLASMPVQKKLIAAQIGAIRALGVFRGEKRAGAALAKLVSRVPPTHPRMAKDPAERRELDERFGMYLAVTGASVNAIGELRYAPAAKTMILAMYRMPELFVQFRRALVTLGPSVKDELRTIVRGTHAEVNALFLDNKLDKYCGDLGDAKTCESVSAKDFYAAIVLGDFYDAAVVPELLAVLERPAAPAYYVDDQPSPVTQYNAVFDALRKIGAPAAAAPIKALWTAKKTDLQTRIGAVSAYPFVARDTTGVDELGKIAADNTADDGLRQEAATAFARLATDAKSIAILDGLAARYIKAAADKKKQAEGKPKRDADAADKMLAAKKQVLDTAKANLLAITQDASKTADEIRSATDAVKKIEDDYKAAKKKHKDAVAPFKQLDTAAKAYRGFARMFQTHIARIEIAIRCKQDLACYGASLELTPVAAAKNVAPYIKDIGEWTPDEKAGLVEATIERAMLEIGKRGAEAAQLTDALLVAARRNERLVRQSILLALPKIAKIPCASCEAQLDAAIKAGEGKTSLGDLNIETTMLRNYFAWAGRP